MVDVRFTKDMVRKLASAVEEFTDGHFGLAGTGTDIGNGVRYIDKHGHKTWLGPNGARECCAYLIGGLLETARLRGENIPDELDWIRDVENAYSPKERFRNWQEQGRERAQFYAMSNNKGA